jgi:hypothetical protein
MRHRQLPLSDKRGRALRSRQAFATDEVRECRSIARRLCFALGMRESSAPPAVRPVLVQRSSVQRRRVDARFQDERGSDRALLLLPESMEGANASVHVGVIYERAERVVHPRRYLISPGTDTTHGNIRR